MPFKQLWLGALALLFPSLLFCLEAENYKIEWSHARLTMTTHATPLAKILNDITAITNLKILNLPSSQETVTLAFTKLPLRDALQRILRGQNYLIVDQQLADGASIPGLVLILDATTPAKQPTAIQDIQKPSINLQSEASQRLAQLEQLIKANAPDLKETLYSATRDSEPLLRELALRELHQRGDPGVVDIIRQDARSDSIDIRRTALEMLPELDEQNAMALLSEAASDNHIDIRQTALEKLSKMEGGADTIKNKLHDLDPSVRIAAIEALASLGPHPSLEAAAAEALHDPDEQVRAKAEAIRQELQAAQASP